MVDLRTVAAVASTLAWATNGALGGWCQSLQINLRTKHAGDLICRAPCARRSVLRQTRAAQFSQATRITRIAQIIAYTLRVCNRHKGSFTSLHALTRRSRDARGQHHSANASTCNGDPWNKFSARKKVSEERPTGSIDNFRVTQQKMHVAPRT